MLLANAQIYTCSCTTFPCSCKELLNCQMPRHQSTRWSVCGSVMRERRLRTPGSFSHTSRACMTYKMAAVSTLCAVVMMQCTWACRAIQHAAQPMVSKSQHQLTVCVCGLLAGHSQAHSCITVLHSMRRWVLSRCADHGKRVHHRHTLPAEVRVHQAQGM